jgi:hypothetical protein
MAAAGLAGVRHVVNVLRCVAYLHKADKAVDLVAT